MADTEPQTIQGKYNQQFRPNTTALDQFVASPKRPLQNELAMSGGLSKEQLKEEINGFKHSFYNDKKDSSRVHKEEQ